jgi:hypothetical protein
MSLIFVRQSKTTHFKKSTNIMATNKNTIQIALDKYFALKKIASIKYAEWSEYETDEELKAAYVHYDAANKKATEYGKTVVKLIKKECDKNGLKNEVDKVLLLPGYKIDEFLVKAAKI